MNYLTNILTANHQRKDFTCGNDLLDRYLHNQVRQDMESKFTVCFIRSSDGKAIDGYYTLSSDSIPRSILPNEVVKKLPKYKSLPVTLLGLLAVALHLQGQGLGQVLLLDALHRSLDASASVGSNAVVVDPINESANSFYEKFGFLRLPDSGKMFLPMRSIHLIFR